MPSGPGVFAVAAVPNTKTPAPLRGFGPQPTYFHERNYLLAGTTVDVNGVVLGSVIVKLFNSATDTLVAQTTSDAVTGVWSFVVDKTQLYYTVEYKVLGTGDVYGSSPNTLAGA